MKAQRFQLETNTSAILMGMALREMTLGAEDISGDTLAYEFDGSLDVFTEDDVWYDDFDYNVVEEITPTEESWTGKTSETMPGTGGVELLRWLMEGVKASEIKNKPATWVAMKYCYFSAMIHGAMFDRSICDEPSQIIGRYSVALEGRLRDFGIGFEFFGGTTEDGYQRLDEIKKQELETV